MSTGLTIFLIATLSLGFAAIVACDNLEETELPVMHPAEDLKEFDA